MKRELYVKGKVVNILSDRETDYISLTDIARYKNSRTDDVIRNWLRNRFTIEFLGFWESINNPNFKPVEFDGIRIGAGLNSFVLTPKQWIEKTKAKGLLSKPGRYGGTYAHKDIAFEFASWISVEFKLYLIKEFQRLKEKEHERLSLSWDVKRELVKINYKIHTDAVKKHLIPPKVSRSDAKKTYASEADLLNKALFGMTAQEWLEKNPKKDNMRDFANVTQLVVLANLETLNSEFIKEELSQEKRLLKLNEIAISQMTLLTDDKQIRKLENKNK